MIIEPIRQLKRGAGHSRRTPLRRVGHDARFSAALGTALAVTHGAVSISVAFIMGDDTPSEISQMTVKSETIAVALCRRLVREGLKRHYTVSVFDGERWAIERSRDERQIFAALFISDIEKLRFKTMIGKFVGDVTLVHSGGENTIYDWTDRNEINELVAAARGPNNR